jgi:hypothetical protein
MIEVDGHYDGEHAWESDDGRFRAFRLSSSNRRWIVLHNGKRWSRSFSDLDAARIAMGEELQKMCTCSKSVQLTFVDKDRAQASIDRSIGPCPVHYQEVLD